MGVGSQGGAEAFAIFHQLIFDEWTARSLETPLARIKVNEKNCFGMTEWNAVRSQQAAVAGWTHRALSSLEQEGVESMPKDRSVEQGDVDAPLEYSLG